PGQDVIHRVVGEARRGGRRERGGQGGEGGGGRDDPAGGMLGHGRYCLDVGCKQVRRPAWPASSHCSPSPAATRRSVPSVESGPSMVQDGQDMQMDSILVGKGGSGDQVRLLARYGNRHGLVAGATGTGKTVTLMTLAEGFSRIGVPVFMADAKGDVSGLAVPGELNAKLQARIDEIGIDGYTSEGAPTIFWDLYGNSGHPVRTTVSEVGPLLLARMLELNDTQSGVLDIAFKLADDRGLLLLDLDDLRALLSLVAAERKAVSSEYGLVSSQSIGAIQRALLRLGQQGGDGFFGEPALELHDLMRTTPDGRGVVGILDATQLILKPRLYSSFLLWLLSELF